MAMLSGAPAGAAEVTHTRLESRELIRIEGEIEYGDQEKFRKLSIIYDDAIVALDSVGGSLVAAIEIGKMVHLKGYPTLVAADAICTSGCALIWVAGSERFLSTKGRLGFHASYLDVGGRLQETGVGNALVGRFLTQLNLPERAIVFATTASPTEIKWLTETNMSNAGIDFTTLDTAPSKVAPTSPPMARTPEVVSNLPTSRESASVKLGDYGPWTLYRNDERHTCNLLAVYESDEALWFEYDAASKGATIMFTEQHASSLAEGAKRTLDVPFVDGKRLDDGWKRIEFTARVSSDGRRMLFSEKLTAQFLDDVAEGSTIGFYYGETLVSAFDLHKAGKAVTALRDCAKRSAGIDPRDPFAQ
jgi:hypothetical protein